ncbi:MAG: DUF4252 domain-containing protein [Rikenellaceae bacterium]|nr:DUF4252 domain-containing protein [Rikenellaceae bacterium]
MKTKLILLTMLMVCSFSVFAQNSPFKKQFDRYKSIKFTYVTKAMMDMAPQMKIGNVMLKDLKNKVEQVEVYSNVMSTQGGGSSNVVASVIMYREAKKILTEGKYELLLQVNEGGKDISFWAKRDKEIIKEMVNVSHYPSKGSRGQCEVLRLVGHFTIEDIKKITK